MSNILSDISGQLESGGDHELHKDTDLARREAHLEELIKSLKKTGMYSSDTSYYAGYTSYKDAAPAKGFSRA